MKEDISQDFDKPFIIDLVQHKFDQGIPIFLQMRSHAGMPTVRYYLSRIEEKTVSFLLSTEKRKRWNLVFSPPATSRALGDTVRSFMAGEDHDDWTLVKHVTKDGKTEFEFTKEPGRTVRQEALLPQVENQPPVEIDLLLHKLEQGKWVGCRYHGADYGKITSARWDDSRGNLVLACAESPVFSQLRVGGKDKLSLRATGNRLYLIIE